MSMLTMVKQVEVVELVKNGRENKNLFYGNAIISRVNGKNIVVDDKRLNSILETPEDGMCFYTKNKKYFDKNLYSEKRFEEIFTKGIVLKRSEDRTVAKLNAYGRILYHIISNIDIPNVGHKSSITNMWTTSDDDDEEDNGDEEEGNEPKSMDDKEEDIRREMRSKKRQEQTEEGQSSVDMTLILDRIAAMQAQLNDRLDELNDKIVSIQYQVTRLEQGGRDTDEDD
ncbi:hypothetical protein M9H77_22221 [Catharanthus roseus]|uniref:Uncharacterized protein n=1 Tax=Catharanthus roseus TaxID=4058 RepID=A0ACC0ASH5_CATRO|nr:hypothetical protein M9H77_22221 [Catharanthus roseus]